MSYRSGINHFLQESNRIEGVYGVTDDEEETAEAFIKLPAIEIKDVSQYVEITAHGAKIRDKEGMNVMIGGYYPPPGGPGIVMQLEVLLGRVSADMVDPYTAHSAYESLHPYMDGNGRSGRLIWLWQMTRFEGGARLGFLHTWYYQSLAAGNSRTPKEEDGVENLRSVDG